MKKNDLLNPLPINYFNNFHGSKLKLEQKCIQTKGSLTKYGLYDSITITSLKLFFVFTQRVPVIKFQIFP